MIVYYNKKLDQLILIESDITVMTMIMLAVVESANVEYIGML